MTVPYGSDIPTSDKSWSLVNFFVQGGDGTIPGLTDRTQPNIIELLKGGVQNSPGWLSSSGAVFQGLDAALGLPLAIISSIIQQLFGLVDLSWATVSGALDDLGQLGTNLMSFLASLNFLDPDFNPIDAAIKFWQLIINPTGLAVSATQVLGVIMSDTLILPFTMGGDGTDVSQWFIDIPQAIIDLIQNIINAFAGLDPTGITGQFGDFMQAAFDLYKGIFVRSKANTAAISSLETKVFGEAGAGGITFAFAGASAALTTLGWNMIDAGAVGMTYTQHDDYVQMTGSAGSDATVIAIYDSADPMQHFSSPVQSCTFLPREQIASSGSTALYQLLRVNNATTLVTLNGVYARLARGGSGGTVDLGILLAGVATDLADIAGVDPADVSATGLTYSAQDRFDLTIGDPTADPILDADTYNWRWRWYLNTNLILDTVYNPFVWDPATANLLDETTYNCPAFGMTADFIFVFFPAMVPPTTLDGLAYYTPAGS